MINYHQQVLIKYNNSIIKYNTWWLTLLKTQHVCMKLIDSWYKWQLIITLNSYSELVWQNQTMYLPNTNENSIFVGNTMFIGYFIIMNGGKCSWLGSDISFAVDPVKSTVVVDMFYSRVKLLHALTLRLSFN